MKESGLKLNLVEHLLKQRENEMWVKSKENVVDIIVKYLSALPHSDE